MFVVGLTGGVGSGKSTVARILSDLGAVIIDADEVARWVVAPGTDGLEAIRRRFGDQFTRPDGSLDRRQLAERVFTSGAELSALNAIVHPRVRAEIERLLGIESSGAAIVVLMVPLLIESNHYEWDYLVTVDCEEDEAVRRVVASRGWSEGEARSRIAAQATRSLRAEAADIVIDNSGTTKELSKQVHDVWTSLLEMSAKR